MKQGIHPEYVECTVRCTCGNTFVTRSTKSELKVDICSACHPFFTGTQKLVDTGGRVQRFADKYGSAKDLVAQREAAKKAAKAAGEKSIEMIKEKELLPLTGYVHGGCSPIGMKKPFPTFVDSTAADYETIMFSAGKIGYQVQMGIGELAKAVSFTLADLRSED